MEGSNTPRTRDMLGTTAVDAENVIVVVYVELGTVSTSHLLRSAMSCLAAEASEERTTKITRMRRITSILLLHRTNVKVLKDALVH